MKSKNSDKSEESFKKATEFLQKIWWFSFLVVIAPLATGLTGYLIFRFFQQNFYIELSFTVITYMFALLFFYKAFDKYRKNPFFLNKENNLVARIHIVYLISILALIVTPIFVYISPADSFLLLPVISFVPLYNIVYYYYRFQPIGFFNKAEGEFKHATNFLILVKQPYNLIIFVNYIAQIIFLSLTFFTEFSWLFALLNNLAFYLITFTLTRKISREINKSIKENKPFLQDLTKYKQRFVISITSLIFILLIQMPFVIMGLSGVQYTGLELMTGSFLSIIFVLIYVKTLFYINYYYNSLLSIYKDPTKSDDSEEEIPAQGIKYQKYNTFLSGVLIGSITFFCFLIRVHWILLIVLPFFFIFAYYEQKAKMYPKQYSKYIYLLNSISILIAISFGLFSNIFFLNIQLIIFLISLYFTLQILVRNKYFIKENIVIIQNFLAIASFTIITYSIFGYTSFENLIVFELAIFPSNPVVTFISNILLHGILISIISLVSFYFLFVRVFSIKRSKLFRFSVFGHVFLIELFIFILVNLRGFSLFEGIIALKLLLLSSLLFPSIFILFIFANYLLGLLSRKHFSQLIYYFLWVLIADIFLVIIFVFFNNTVLPVMLTLDFLFLSIFCQFNLKFGLNLGKVKDSTFERYVKINPYILTLELFALFFFSFYSVILIDLAWFDKIIFSSYFSLLVMTFLINILSRRNRVFSASIAFKINLIFLMFSAGLAFYYSFYYTLSTFYVFVTPFLSLFSILFFPIYYMYRKKIHLPLEKKYQEEEKGEEDQREGDGEEKVEKEEEREEEKEENVMRKFLIADCIILAIFITLIPSIISLEIYRLGLSVNILPTISFTILILPSILIFFVFVNHLLGVFSRKQFLLINHYVLWFLITNIFVAIFLTFLSNFVILALDFLFFSIFIQLNLKFGLKLGRVKETTFKRLSNLNSYVMAVELFILFFFFFYFLILINLAFYDNLILSIYLSLLVITILGNLFSKKELIFSKSMSIKINITTLIFSAGTAFYYSFLFTFSTFYVFLIPFLCLFSILFFPFYYLIKMKRYENLTRKILVIDCILIAIFLTFIPSILGLDLYFRLGELVDVISFLNFTFYIAISLLIFIYYLVKHYGMKDKYQLGVLKSQVIIEICLTGTTAFYYIFMLFSGTMYGFLIPFIAASCFFYLPILFSYKKRLFNVNLVKNTIFVNSLLLSGLIVLIPTFVGLEISSLGLGARIDFFMVTVLTLILLFVILKFLDFVCIKFKILEKIIKHLKLLEILAWFSFSLFTALWIFPYLLTELSFSLTIFTFFMLNIYTLRLLSDYSKELKISNYLLESILYGIVFSFSYLLVSLIQITFILNFLPSGLTSLNIVWYLGLFFLFSLIFIRLKLIKPRFESLRNWVELISWFSFKIFVSLFISVVLPLSILTQIIIFILIFSILSPVTLIYFKKLKIISEVAQFFTKKILLALFIISSLSLYLDLFNNFTRPILSFNISNFIPLTVIIANLFLFVYFCLLRYNSVIENYSITQLTRFYLSSFLLLISLFFMYFPLPIFSFFTLILIISRRSIINIFRFLAYLILGYILFIAITAFPFGGFIYVNSFDLNLLGYYSQIYLSALSIVLLFSIWLNIKKNNILEKFTLYSTFSLLSFVVLFSYSLIPLIYNITISLFIFLFFMGIYFYRLKNVLYKWFIKPCVLLAVFDLMSFISYFLLFNQPPYNQLPYVGLNQILTFTLTIGITGFVFLFLFNKAPANFRKKSFYFVLFAIILCIPTFLYFLIVSSFSIPFEDPVPIIFSINVGVFLFYLCVGIYQGRVSWAIWKSGWYVWNILPFVNFIIIYKSLSGVDVIKDSISLFGPNGFTGSSILSIIICSLFFLPVIYAKIKKHFLKIIFIVWGESLFLLYWISQNLFLSDLLLRNLLFVLFTVLLLMPILIGLKYWKIVSIFWITLIVINALFLLFYLVSIGISLEVTISIDILVIGLLMIIYSFFPNVRSIGIILIISYFIVLTGIFITVYFVILSVVQNYIFSVNISLMVVGFSLFSSKSIKLSHRIIDLCLSWILIFNFAWLTFNTFSLVPQLVLFAFFLALTVLGCSFFIFNKYKLKFHLNRAIPLFIVAIGASSSITSLFSVFLGASPYILISIFSGVFVIFLYFIIIEYRYFLWSLIPIPLALPVFELFLSIEVILSLWFLAFLTFSIIYITFFQVIFNLFKNYERDDTKEMKYEGDDKIEMKNSMKKIFQDKNQIKLVNFTCFILNSLFISLFISILVPVLQNQFLFNHIIFVYQIMDFLIIWPIFILFSLKYIEKSEIKIKLRDPLLYFNKICRGIYLLIPTAMIINLLLFMIYANIDAIIIFYLIALIFSGVIFFESYVIDRRFFYYLLNSTRDKFSFWSLSAFINLLAFFFFMYHQNIFLLIVTISLLNQLCFNFLSHLDVSKEKISNGRVILYYILFISGSFYFGSLISNGIMILFGVLSDLTYYLLIFQNSFLILFILSYFLIKEDIKLKRAIEMILLMVFQVLLAINFITIFSLFNILNIFSTILIILIETCFSFQTIKYINSLFYKGRKPEFLTRAFSLLIILLYFETSLLFYGLMIIFTGIFGSILVSQLIFFGLTLLDIYSLKKIKRGYAQLIHTLSFFVISLMILLILNTSAPLYQILLSLEVLLFMLMQFYTNYSFFVSWHQLYPNKKELIDKRRTEITRLLGIVFYVNLFILLLQGLLIFSLDLQLIFLLLSLLVHILMIIDTYVLKFIGKVSNYLKVFSWAFILAFTTIYLIWIYLLYFFSYLATSIPLLIFILLFETAYLFKLLDFSKYVISNKKKIKKILLYILYLDFITWPVYNATLNPFYSLNLILASVGILFILTYVDKYLIGAFNEKQQVKLRKISFLTIGILLSFDIFISLGFILSLNLFFTLSVALFTFVIFLGIIIKPFKEHSTIALAFWVAIFSLLSLIIFFSSNLFGISVAIFVITVIIYPFVFLLEELRELFNSFVDVLIKTFKKINLLILSFLRTVFNFVKIHFKVIWIIISAFLGIFVGTLLSDITLGFLNPVHSVLLALAIFGLLYLVIPSPQTDDPDIIFKRRILRLSVGWGSVIGLLFIVITPVWYIFTVLISIAVVGSIILVYIGRKEEREKISVKWRFYTLLSLFILLILFLVLFIIQLPTLPI